MLITAIKSFLGQALAAIKKCNLFTFFLSLIGSKKVCWQTDFSKVEWITIAKKMSQILISLTTGFASCVRHFYSIFLKLGWLEYLLYKFKTWLVHKLLDFFWWLNRHKINRPLKLWLIYKAVDYFMALDWRHVEAGKPYWRGRIL